MNLNQNRIKRDLVLFSAITGTIPAVLYAYLRTGFDSNSLMLFKLLGTFFFLISINPFLIFLNSITQNTVKTIFISLVLISLFGLLQIQIPIYFLGYVLLILLLLKIRITRIEVIFIIITSFLMGLNIAVSCWAHHTLSPTFLESMAAGILNWDEWNGTDTLYHVSLSQMIKTYGLPSTGIDGLPFAFYHFGSHWLFAQMSSFLNISALDFYNAGYPIVIVPLFFHLLFSFIKDIADKMGNQFSSSIIPMIILTLFFCQLIRHYYAGGGLGNSFLISESTTVSLIFLIFFWDIMIETFRSDKNLSDVKKITLVIILTLTLLAIGLSKISTYFLVETSILYLFLRCKLFRSKEIIVLALINIGVTLFVLYITVEELPFNIHSHAKKGMESLALGQTGFFSHQFHLWDFILFFSYHAIFIVVFFVRMEVFSLETLKHRLASKHLIVLELIIVISIAGFIPILLLDLYPPNYMYFLFLGPILCVSATIIYFPKNFIPKISGWRKISVSIVLTIILFTIVFIPLRKDLRYLIRKSILTQSHLRNEKHAIPNNEKISELVKKLTDTKKNSSLAQSNYRLTILKKLTQFDSLSIAEKRRSVIKFDISKINAVSMIDNPVNWIDSTKVNKRWMLYCYDLPLVVTALSGIAMIDGMPCNCNNLNSHGYIAYKDKTECNNSETIKIIEKIKFNKYFKNTLYIYSFNYLSNEFELLSLK